MQADGLTISLIAAVHLAATAALVVFKASRIEISIRNKIAALELKFQKNLDSANDKLAERLRAEHAELSRSAGEAIEELRRNTGEALTAIRTKMHENEMWGRDNYVRAQDFRPVIEGLTRSIDRIGDELKAAVHRIEDKVELLREARVAKPDRSGA